MPRPDGENVLLVCTANRCRSPLAAATLAYRSAQAGLAWTVTSAGVRTHPGEVIEAGVIAVLGEFGIRAVERPVRQLDETAAGGADLVLTAERSHRSRVLELAPNRVGRVFTLLEFERLLAAAQHYDPTQRSRSLTELAATADSARSLAGSGGRGDDLADPVGRPIEVFRESQRVIERIMARILAGVGG